MQVKTLLLLAVYFCFNQVTYSQSTFTFSQIPADFQLFARDNSNRAVITIAGTAQNAGTEKLLVQVWRENQLWKRSLITLPISRPASFSTTFSIQAEKAQYKIRVFSLVGSDSVLVTERSRIVCGDFIQIYGQSNAIAFNPDYSTDDTYFRNVDFTIGTSVSEGKVSWYPSKEPYGAVGLIGWRLQELILQQFGIPTCIINGAVGGARIAYLNDRNAQNPTDLNTVYGQTLYRHQYANAISHLRAIVWKQGESDAGGAFSNANEYAPQFNSLYNNWRQDYGSSPRMYVGQINFLPDHNSNAGGIRDFQRRTKSLYANLETIATVGTPGFDGIHYSLAGNLQIANELFRQIARDLYGATDTLQINSPDIQKVYYNSSRDTLTMVFDDRMQMIWPADSTIYDNTMAVNYQRRMKDFIYLDSQPGFISTGSASANRVILALTQPRNAQTLTYLPPFFADAHTDFYNGVHLKNSRGMRAFSFENFTITDILPGTVSLQTITLRPKNHVLLSWNSPPTPPTGYLIERANSINGPFSFVGRTVGSVTNFTDTTVSLEPTTLYYRLRMISATSESAPGGVLSIQTADQDKADLQLAMRTSSRIVQVQSPVSVTLLLTNNSSVAPSRVVVENRLPPNLQFISGDGITHTSGVVSATTTSLAPRQTVSWTYIVRPQQLGTYRNAAQILSSSAEDPDSQPGSGTGDGEDDVAQVDVRTVPAADNVIFISPNPNQHPLPPVQLIQPVPVANKADLSLQIASSKITPGLNDLISFTLAVTNLGGAIAQTVQIKETIPEQIAIIGANGWTINGGQMSTTLTNVAVGETRLVTFTAQVIGGGTFINRAEISSAFPSDPDSMPGNGTANGEDDTAQIQLRVR
ncbi:hypothetical protein GCM10027592_02230 [Spirosoma flavus]